MKTNGINLPYCAYGAVEEAIFLLFGAQGTSREPHPPLSESYFLCLQNAHLFCFPASCNYLPAPFHAI